MGIRDGELFKECTKAWYSILTSILLGDLKFNTEERKKQLKELLAVTDMLMLDIKMFDADKHITINRKR